MLVRLEAIPLKAPVVFFVWVSVLFMAVAALLNEAAVLSPALSPAIPALVRSVVTLFNDLEKSAVSALYFIKIVSAAITYN